ncbi:MAG: hypothetical protein AB7I48_01450 [Planctomycetaceae bacterium]
MSKVIAVDRTERRLRYVLADISSRAQVSILAADVLHVAEDSEPAAVELGRRLGEVLTNQKATRARLLIGLGRGALETVEFTVPAAEESELPLLVRNLAMRNLSSINDETVLDFLASPPRGDRSRDVTAMTVRDDVRQELDRLTEAAGTAAARILVRPYELQPLLNDAALASQVVLIVCSSSQVVDMLLVHPEGWRLARSIRIAETSSPSASAGQAVNEIRRTLFSLPIEDFDATHIDRIVLFADPDELQPLATELGTALDAPVQRQHPFADPRVRIQSLPAAASEFAPLVGMLLNEAEGRHPIDFLNPRQPPQPINRRKALLTGAAVVGALFAGAAYIVSGQFAEIDEHNAALIVRRNELKGLVKEVQPKLQLAKALEAWENSRISWLDELRDLTLRMPPSSDLTVQRFSASPSRGTEATITFSGESRSPDVVAQMEQSLRDDHHRPKTPGVRERLTQERPVWTFQTTMTVSARSADEYTAHREPQESRPALAASESAPSPKTTEPH